jgi:hypothetical protein
MIQGQPGPKSNAKTGHHKREDKAITFCAYTAARHCGKAACFFSNKQKTAIDRKISFQPSQNVHGFGFGTTPGIFLLL